MYADRITPSMHRAISETERRRKLQEAFNEAHGIVPKTIKKSVKDVIEISSESKLPGGRGKGKKLSNAEAVAEIARLTRQMKEAAKLLEFELAAELRDKIKALEDAQTAKQDKRKKEFLK